MRDIAPAPSQPSSSGHQATVSTSTLPSHTQATASKPPRRRIRPKIVLDPNQPLTAQGKPRARVIVACNQCRVRKTRCDGAKPVCFHCRKRPPENGESCSYDVQAGRRGRDRAPGTRIRQPPAKRRRTSMRDASLESDVDRDQTQDSRSRSPESTMLELPDASGERCESAYWSDDCDSDDDSFAIDFDDLLCPPGFASTPETKHADGAEAESIPARPSLQFTRETWWDALLAFYCYEDSATPIHALCLTADQCNNALVRIVADLRALFRSSFYWLSFVHIPRFFESILDPAHRASMQPSLLLSALALGTLAQSSDADKGAVGRARALRLLEFADGALQASLSSGWVDVGLVKASWLIVYFDMQFHPFKSVARSNSSLVLLDSLMRLFSLTSLDADVKSSRYSMPALAANGLRASTNSSSSSLSEPIVPDNLVLPPSASPPPLTCNCAELAMGHDWPEVRELAPSWSGTIMWPRGLSEGEMLKEECRRLAWSTIMLTATLNSYTCVVGCEDEPRLSIQDPRNYALLFPGDTLALTGTPVSANNLWTLYLRSMLILHACIRVRRDPGLSDADRAQFAMSAWLEIDAVESAFERHTCGLEKKSGSQAREMLFSARMCISHEFQRYIPQVSTRGGKIFYRDKAEAWIRQRLDIVEKIWTNVQQGRYVPIMDYRKPMLIYWYMSHIIKALMLWRADPTLLIALIASKTFAMRVEYIMLFWPGAERRKEWQDVRYQLVEACIKAGIPPPDRTIPVPFPSVKNVTRCGDAPA
ncbi:hypothetical protein C8Q73DRAFT_701968 [Cubamyces lactineus]|nr:hypothetical protein C8Q73DRAFT_701968 [Cubamyces lactineus]